jgi:hypothetical protein
MFAGKLVDRPPHRDITASSRGEDPDGFGDAASGGLLMKHMLLASAAVVLFTAGTGTAQDIVFKPIDTNRLVVQPSRKAASLAAQSIDIVGTTAGNSLANNGYIKTINNLFKRTISIPMRQPGRSGLPSPHLFPSTRYQNFNTPVMPTYQRRH